MGPLDGLIQAAKYRETCPPQSCLEQLLVDQILRQDLDPGLLHWAHPATMLLLVAPCLLFAASLGWKIRGSGSQDGSDAAPKMTGEERRSAGSMHALLMSTALFFSIFGIQGGLGSMLLARQPILESPHSVSGFFFTAVLGLQVFSRLSGFCRSLAPFLPLFLPFLRKRVEDKVNGQGGRGWGHILQAVFRVEILPVEPFG